MKVLGLILSAILVIWAGMASAVTVDLRVSSQMHGAFSTDGLFTGLHLRHGDSLFGSADPGDKWALAGRLGITSDADGNPAAGIMTQDGLTAPIGALVARVGQGDFFKIGTGYEGVVSQSGPLYLFIWDNRLTDNAGNIAVQLTLVPTAQVPAPAGGLVLALASLILARSYPRDGRRAQTSRRPQSRA